MDNHPPVHRAAKRKRTGKGRRVIADGDDITADGILVRTVSRQTEQGSVKEVRSRPVWLNEEKQHDKVRDNVPVEAPHTADQTEDVQMDWPDDSGFPNIPNSTKTQQYYLDEFVSRVDPLLKALLSREVAPQVKCSRCAQESIARWRCRDCTSGKMVCRGCMRVTHIDNPLHHIEMWTGRYFRRAELWQVGLYIMIPHHTGERLCAGLKWNQTLLNGFQVSHDAREQTELTRGWPTGPFHHRAESCGTSGHGDDHENVEGDVDPLDSAGVAPEATPELGTGNGEEGPEMDEINEDPDVPLNPPPDYFPSNFGIPKPHNDASWTVDMDTEMDTEMPRADALDNPFVRVIDTNGVHSIAVVSCACRGRENTHSDLMASRLIPTSFARYRTMFTHAVLDDFRVSNLECKVSAYQYFQKLRRLSSSMQPDSVPNLYHELRRMSRVWRWLKKLKWAGTGCSSGDNVIPTAGGLANFCPTCPQPAINLPDDWQLDPNR